MPDAPRPSDETSRLQALRAYDILDTPAEPSFDRLSRLAAQVLGTPIALVTLVDDERQWFKSRVGFDLHETNRAASFCAWCVADRSVVVVPDAMDDPRFQDNPLVLGAPGIRFYAGAPLTTPGGFVLGTLCGLDTVPRREGLTDLQQRQLTDLAALVVDELELRRSVRLLAEQRRQLEVVTLATDAAGDAILVTDATPISAPDGPRIVYANQAFLDMSGYERHEVLGQTPRLVQGPDTDPAALARIREAIGAGREVRERLCNYRKDGTPYWVDVHIAPVLTRHSEARQYIAVQREVTQQGAGAQPTPPALAGDISTGRQSDAQLRQAQKMEALGTLAGGVAHDFNNLLTVINGYVDMLLRQAEDASVREHLQQIQRAGDRAAALTQQLLAFSRRQVLQPQVVSPAAFLTEVRPMLARALPEHITLTVTADDTLPPVLVDPNQLELVLLNLVGNAADAMPQGGDLLIQCHEQVVGPDGPHDVDVRPGRYLVIAVSDTGTGMDDAVLARLFEPFFTTRPKGRGTGLGLPTAYGIVTQSQGHLTACSKPGSGSTFRIYLPLATRSTISAEDASRPVVGDVHGHETVLLVEDDAGVRQFAAALLTAYGYHVVAAPDGPTALQAAAEHDGPIDLVLTDVVMPRMGGREVAAAVQRTFGRARVVYMSGYTENAVLSHGVRDPGLCFLQKPFTPTQLLHKVREALDTTPPALTVVVADDEAPLRKLLALTLRRAGYQVLEARHGGEAIELCRLHHVDLLLTDLVMPEQEGLETIRQLRTDLPHVQIVAMSGAFDGRFLNVARAFGASAVLQKPFDGRTALETVSTLIGTP